MRIMTGFNSFKKKSTFQKISHFIALGNKFDLDVKLVKVNLGSLVMILNKLDRPYIPNATYQVPRSLAFRFWRIFLKGFYHIWAWWPSCSCDEDHLNKLSFPHPRESHMKFKFNWPTCFRGEDV